MQLPSDEELILISGCQPIRAKKARYFEDRQLRTRIMPPPAPSVAPDTTGGVDPTFGSGDEQWAGALVPPATRAADPSNAGVRREPELPAHEEIVPEPRKPVLEFELEDDEPAEGTDDLQALQRRTRRLARQATLDPGDGVDL